MPSPPIYIRHGGTYVPLTEQKFDAERVLQELIERHPEMLAGDHADHGPLILVKREAGVADADDSAPRWSLDHLYLDADGVPTLVEVKRSSDTRARREVVAQMLDYAANAKTSFNVGQLRAWLDEAALLAGTSADQALRDVLGVDDVDDFWQTVATNLAAERMRLLFVADRIAPELRRIIEYLNGQMERTDLLAIEVTQYTDATGDHQTIVPRVIGDTERAKAVKGKRRTKMDRQRLISALRETDGDGATAAEELLAWGERHPYLEVQWKSAANLGVPGQQPLLRVFADGTVGVIVNTLRHAETAWDDDRVEQFLRRLEAVEGVAFTGNRRQWPVTPLAPLADPGRCAAFLALIEEAVDGIATADPDQRMPTR